MPFRQCSNHHNADICEPQPFSGRDREKSKNRERIETL